MSLVKEGMLVYPLKQYRILIGDQVVYDRDTRGKSWFVLDLVLPGAKFIPEDSSGLVTADGQIFCVHSRHLDHPLPDPKFIPKDSSGLVTADGKIFYERS